VQGQPQSSVRQSVARRAKLPIISSFVRPKSKGGNERPECGIRRPFTGMYCHGARCAVASTVVSSCCGTKCRGLTSVWPAAKHGANKYHCKNIQQVQFCTQMSWDCCVRWGGIPIFSVIVRIKRVVGAVGCNIDNSTARRSCWEKDVPVSIVRKARKATHGNAGANRDTHPSSVGQRPKINTGNCKRGNLVGLL